MSVLFNSTRPLGRCENLTAVFEAYDGIKRFAIGGYIDVSNHPENVIVTDEFVRNKRPNQKVVMIAHGLTGGKLYGSDQKHGIFTKNPDSCSLVDYYITSSEYGRKFASSAAGIPMERCLPLGMPRTDAYFNKRKGDGRTFLADYGRAYLYVPTFRASYDEQPVSINWRCIDELLSDDEILVVKRHMITSTPLVDCQLERVIEVDHVEPSTRYLIDCDVLATDFSSILFDGYVLGKPSVLTATANDRYLETRGMYMNYPREYGSRAVEIGGHEQRFVKHLRSACKTGMRKTERDCLEKTASACDGKSTARVVDLVKSLL